MPRGQKANVHPLDIMGDNHKFLPPAPSHQDAPGTFCAGGVVLASRVGKIVCENTLDACLDVVFRKKIPEIHPSSQISIFWEYEQSLWVTTLRSTAASSVELSKDRRNGVDQFLLRTSRGASALVSLHGGQVLSWKTDRGEELLFTSSKAIFKPPHPVRGGIPRCFPQLEMSV
ncbi:hypothetical protein MLD38_039070 [Melastoma candidum]|uniref:Uncharacterized protein n=1 Tax=Melastoma candidum TaxID=119954 RepID=A0ACB9L0X3_9MYRT|nr:hypothetical protein MLD38_039070 [Melastoma candidum]